MDSLFKSSFFNFLSQVTIFLSAAVLSVLLARILGPEQMGQYSYWMWLIGTSALIFTLGLPRSIVRYVAQFKSRKSQTSQIISRTLFYQIKILSLFLLAALTLIFLFGGVEKFTYLIIAATLSTSVINSLLGSALFGLQKYGFLFRINFLTSALSFVSVVCILFYAKNLTNLLLVNLLVLCVSLSASTYYLKDYIKFNTKPLSLKVYNNIRNYTLSISAIVFLDLILMERSEIFFLKNFSTIEQIAFYSVGFGLVGRVMTLIPGAVSGVIMPKIAWLHGKKELENIKLTYFSSTRYLILITLPIIFAGIILIDLPVKIFYGYDYLTLIPVIQILLISGGLSAIVAAAAAVLYGTGGQKFILKLAGVAAVFNIILDILFIPSMGAVGAAIANFLAQILGVIIGTFYLVRIKKMPFPWVGLSKIFTAASTSAIFIYSIKARLYYFDKLYLLAILFVIYIATYLIVLISLKFFIKQDFDVIKKITNKILFFLKK